METDPGGLGICWVGDSPSESFLPEHQDPAIVRRYEDLSASLDRRVNHPGMPASAFRDTIALAVAEGRALVLSHLPERDGAERPPAICGALGEWGIPCRIVEPDDPLAILERDCVRRLLVQAGVARLCWAGLRLVALHVVAPAGADSTVRPRTTLISPTKATLKRILPRRPRKRGMPGRAPRGSGIRSEVPEPEG